MKRLQLLLSLLLLAVPLAAFGQTNGDTLRIVYPDLMEGEAAFAITPGGTVIAFDAGPVGGSCDALVAVYEEAGVETIHHLVISHYDDATLGCVGALVERFGLTGRVIDRGGVRPGRSFRHYRRVLGDLRERARPGQRMEVDTAGRFDAEPVELSFPMVNARMRGGRVRVPARAQRARGVVTKLSFGRFETVFGGAIGGLDTGQDFDVEALAAEAVGEVEVYTVHREGATTATSAVWLDETTPVVAIVTVDELDALGNRLLPSPDTMFRLRERGIRSYWNHRGNGALPIKRFDSVCGTVTVTYERGDDFFRVHCSGRGGPDGRTRRHRLNPESGTGDNGGSGGSGGGTGDGGGGGTGGDGDGGSGGGGDGGGVDGGGGGGHGGGHGGGGDDGGRQPFLVLQVDGSATPEVASIRNDGADSIDLSGWVLLSVNGDESYEFPASTTLTAGATLELVSDTRGSLDSALEKLFANGAVLWSADAIWDDGGDRAVLLDERGRVILEVIVSG